MQKYFTIYNKYGSIFYSWPICKLYSESKYRPPFTAFGATDCVVISNVPSLETPNVLTSPLYMDNASPESSFLRAKEPVTCSSLVVE